MSGIGLGLPISRRAAAKGAGRAAPRRDVRASASAAAREPREGNVDGQFYVDHTCINCDTCRWMAPDTFATVGAGSAAVAQPADSEQRIAAIQATLSCPTCALCCLCMQLCPFEVCIGRTAE